MEKHFKQGPRSDIGPQLVLNIGDIMAKRKFKFKDGVAADLPAPLNNIWFRSSWEKNIARLLTYLGITWQYEVHRFWFDGTHSYLPDFRLDSPSPWNVKWLEVKGLWNRGDRLRLKLFAHFEPEETFHVLMKEEYLALEKQYKDVIPNWEGRIKKPRGKRKKKEN